MEELFLQIVNMSVAASWFILALILLRLILKKAPKVVTCVLWAIVGLRLLIPFSVESPFSLVPSAQTFPKEFLYAAEPKIESGFEFIDDALNPVIADVLAPDPLTSANPTQINAIIFSAAWVFGMALILVYAAVIFIRVKLRVREAVCISENIYICDRVETPFILGIICPRIYLPSDIGENDAAYVIAHEKAHIKRPDFIWKPLGFLALAVHWFNPLVWLAYVLFCRDIELACDEKVIRELGSEEKKAYS
jgi:beta-lactamase regulating signal transducer with metallopeptidase domain